MKPLILVVVMAVPFLSSASETHIEIKDLPPAVQAAVKAGTKGAHIKGFAKEIKDGRTYYEAETSVNGRSRDLLFDTSGALVEVEQQVTLDALPAKARAAILKEAAGGNISKVETVSKGQNTRYEAAIVRHGRTSEIAVNADGARLK